MKRLFIFTVLFCIGMLQMAADIYSNYTDKNGVTWEYKATPTYDYESNTYQYYASIIAASDYGEDVVMPDTVYNDGVAYAVTSLSRDVFKGNETIKKVTLAKGITNLNIETFSGCSSLVAVNVFNCTTVSSSAFENCSNLASINLPQCKTVDAAAFANCTSLVFIDIKQCTSIASYAFLNCTSLTSIDLSQCKSVGYEAFSNCTNLTSVALPNCTTIDKATFYNCSSLASIDLPNCTKIGSAAFYNCVVPCQALSFPIV